LDIGSSVSRGASVYLLDFVSTLCALHWEMARLSLPGSVEECFWASVCVYFIIILLLFILLFRWVRHSWRSRTGEWKS